MNIHIAPIEEVNLFVNIEDILNENKFDGCPDVIVMPERDDVEYLGLYLDGMIGLAVLHPRDDGKEFHMSILKGFRHLSRQFLTYFAEPVMYANPPKYKKSVINLVKKLGFKSLGDVGVFTKDGIDYPKELLCLS